MRVILFGATRGCGLETLSVLLNQGGPQMEVHVMVRNKEAFSAHLQNQSLDAAKLKQLRISVGDALIPEQVQSFIQGVAKSGQIDAVISSLGVAPDFKITQPFNVMPAGSENLCRDSMVNILAALEKIAPMQEDKRVPRLIVVSSNGMDKPSHNALPWLLRPVCELSSMMIQMS
jgi:NAD(P)-dependent dehydrogenase (short-subunit alcohol dehydrogenase family)